MKTVKKMYQCVERIFVEMERLTRIFEKNVTTEKIMERTENVLSCVQYTIQIIQTVEMERLMNEKTVKTVL